MAFARLGAHLHVREKNVAKVLARAQLLLPAFCRLRLVLARVWVLHFWGQKSSLIGGTACIGATLAWFFGCRDFVFGVRVCLFARHANSAALA